jgi:hypothetical protein
MTRKKLMLVLLCLTAGALTAQQPMAKEAKVTPEHFRLDELVRQALAARKDPREVVADPHALYYGVELSESTLLPGDGARLGETRFETWLNQPADQIPPAKPLTTAVAAASNRDTGPQR